MRSYPDLVQHSGLARERTGQEREEMLLEEISSSCYLQAIKIRRGEC